MNSPKAHRLIILLLFLLLALPVFAAAKQKQDRSGEIQKNIQAEGACAVVGMSAEQSQLTALQRARSAAIEQASGVSVTSATLVTNYAVAADFIKTYSRGFITGEKVTWLPLGQYQKDSSTAPIPEYRVKIVADVYLPKRKASAVGLHASLNNSVFRAGEKCVVRIKTRKAAGVAVFNITADDKVVLLFPNEYERKNVNPTGHTLIFPAKDAKVEMEMQTLPDHKKDAEAVYVIAWDEERKIDITNHFVPGDALPVSDFFAKLMEIIDRCEDQILPYEVVAQ